MIIQLRSFKFLTIDAHFEDFSGFFSGSGLVVSPLGRASGIERLAAAPSLAVLAVGEACCDRSVASDAVISVVVVVVVASITQNPKCGKARLEIHSVLNVAKDNGAR
jgi:hypothetical protein